MTRKKWTTNDQLAWLKAHSEGFAEAEANNTRKAFFERILTEWCEEYPIPNPTPEEVQQAGGHEQAITRNMKELDKVNMLSYMLCHMNGLPL